MNSILSLIKLVGLPVLLLLGYLISPFGYGFIFGYLLFIFFLLSGKTIIDLLDKDVIILTIFTVIYALYYSFNPVSGSQFIFIYLIFPPIFYLLGKLISKKINDYTQIYNFILFLSIVYSSIALLSVLYSIQTKGFVVVNRNISMIWESTIMNATGMAAYLFANMCIPALLLFTFKKNSLIKNIVLSIIYVLSIIATLRLGSRTQLVISFITLICSALYFISKQTGVKKIISFGVITILTLAVVTFADFDLKSDAFSAYSGRIESKKYGASTAGGRTERWEKSIINLYEKPLGWDVKDFGLSHNLWLDGARVGTVIGFIFLVLFSVLSTRKIYFFIKNKKIPLPLRNLSLVYFLAFYLQFFVEPILDGSIQLFVFYCLFQGLINESQILNKKIE